MKDVLIKSRGMKPMWTVLKRYGIGNEDQYDRGLWITIQDLPVIRENMLKDKTILDRWLPDQIMVEGSNRHNYVEFMEFVAPFAGVTFSTDTWKVINAFYEEHFRGK